MTLAWDVQSSGIVGVFFMCADDIILLAPSVSALQRLLHVCEDQLKWLDMSINVNKSACIRIGSRLSLIHI